MIDVCTVAGCYENISSNLSGFVYKLGPVDQFFCPHFKRQPLAMLCTVKVNISFVMSVFVSVSSLICIFLLMFSTVGVRMFLNK